MCRIPLQANQHITLKLNGTNDERDFTIDSFIEPGGSCLSYRAFYEGGAPGVLKEFYHRNIPTERDENNRLIIEGVQADFQNSLENYIQPYLTLNEMKREQNYEHLAAFIPPFDIYYGNNTAYIWMPNRELYTFKRFCARVHKYPKVGAKYRLIQTINAVKSLAERVGDLHSLGLLHRDITPSNFGFHQFHEEPIMQALEMLDIDTIKSISEARHYFHENLGNITGTNGYIAPETANEPPNNKNDIYSIGAVLFHALISENDMVQCGYNVLPQDIDGYFEMLTDILDKPLYETSSLIKAFIEGTGKKEQSESKNIVEKITAVLNKCVCHEPERYMDCEELVSSLNEILIALGSIEAAYTRYLQDEQNRLLMIMQYHIYKHTLFEEMPDNEDTMRILIKGFDNYAQTFLDVCLQAGQIPGKRLNVRVICSSTDEQDRYLSQRPEFSNFFNLNGAESYGKVSFVLDDANVFAEAIHYYSPTYIFISSGDNEQNIELANEARHNHGNFSVNFVQSGDLEQRHFVGMNPVYVDENFNDPEIERMALNAHLIWEKNWSKGHEEIEHDFKEPYNYTSCISNIISLKYKLFSLFGENISFENEENRLNIADEFSQALNTETRRYELICCEHKRWVTEKICKGWRCLEDFTNCNTERDRKNDYAKRHVCIVKSRPEQVLDNDTDTWDNDDIAHLDALDRASVEFHRHFLKLTDGVAAENITSHAMHIKSNITDFPEIATLFSEWYSCVKDILKTTERNVQIIRSRVNLYSNFTNAFKTEVDGLPDGHIKSVLLDDIKTFENAFAPIVEARKYKDFKQEDVALVDNIPFILTYTTKINLVVPYYSDVNNNTQFFGNVASTLFINPQRVLYVCMGTDNMLERSIGKLKALLAKRNKSDLIEFLIIGPNNNFTYPGIKITHCTNIPAAIDYIVNINDGITVIERNGADLSDAITGSFSFNSAEMKFENAIGFSRAFKYVRNQPVPFITVHDVFMLSADDANKQCNNPEFFEDYRSLWNIYRHGMYNNDLNYNYAWKRMCQALDRYFRERYIVEFDLLNNREVFDQVRTVKYVISLNCRHAVKKILNALLENNIIESSEFESLNTSSYRVRIEYRHDIRKELDYIFDDRDKLTKPEAFDIYSVGHTLNIQYTEGMWVDDCQLTDERDAQDNTYVFVDYVAEIADRLCRKGYIIGPIVNADNHTISLCLATPQIKDLLTSAGRMLEVFVYHKTREFAGFNDIASSFYVQWNNENRGSNEFDMVLTKGFKTLIVECKARYRLYNNDEDNYDDVYETFNAHTAHWGINAKRVLVADLGGHENDEANLQCINIGRTEYGIETIFDPQEIENIGEVLLNYLEEKGRFAPHG